MEQYSKSLGQYWAVHITGVHCPEDWVCIGVISANVDKRITAVKFILALVCLDIYED